MSSQTESTADIQMVFTPGDIVKWRGSGTEKDPATPDLGIVLNSRIDETGVADTERVIVLWELRVKSGKLFEDPARKMFKVHRLVEGDKCLYRYQKENKRTGRVVGVAEEAVLPIVHENYTPGDSSLQFNDGGALSLLQAIGGWKPRVLMIEWRNRDKTFETELVNELLVKYLPPSLEATYDTEEHVKWARERDAKMFELWNSGELVIGQYMDQDGNVRDRTTGLLVGQEHQEAQSDLGVLEKNHTTRLYEEP